MRPRGVTAAGLRQPGEQAAITTILLIRHAATAWNESGRIQGRTDIPLSASGRASAARYRLPSGFGGAQVVSSPLLRTLETAELMGLVVARRETALLEMDWGVWEGRTLAEIRAEGGDDMVANEARGLDFRPPGGESPRDVQQRLCPWLRRVALHRAPVIGFTHKGVIRALLALSLDWDMRGPSSVKLQRDCGHLFRVESEDEVRLEQPNLVLV